VLAFMIARIILKIMRGYWAFNLPRDNLNIYGYYYLLCFPRFSQLSAAQEPAYIP
jgi:hypothetical protein